MKYMVMIYGNTETWERLAAQGLDEVMAAHGRLVEELTASGELVANAGLTTVGARTVRVVDGTPAVTDGPFTEAKEVLAGYYVVDCADLDRATEIAARLPEAPYSPIEVRAMPDRAVENW